MFLLFSSALSQVFFLLSYVSTSNSFPKPLSAKQEKEALERLKNGDTTARNLLIEKNLRLVAFIAKKYSSQNYDADDLISIGTIGLIKAINTFDQNKGIRLATYASRCIDNEILMVIRNGKKLMNEVSLEEPIGIDKEGNEISFIDIIAKDDDDVIESVEIGTQVKKMYSAIENVLDEREKKVIMYRYGLNNFEEKTQREIAKLLGISRSYVSRIEKKALKKLRTQF
ncbi:MAG: RNA polymerase sporulation sigma factor SigK [Clostridia bacterium]|nr:RNA polymerase sporulation sigma factor SigK [Clostridia bacterium]